MEHVKPHYNKYMPEKPFKQLVKKTINMMRIGKAFKEEVYNKKLPLSTIRKKNLKSNK